MSTVKTAISIDRKIFRKVNTLSHRLRISRSQFFSQAAEYMIKKNENLELLRKINAAVDAGGPDPEEKKLLEVHKQYFFTKVADKW
jgi:metal-responsive CopG/Arc/MetJ family transcriptional regulator